MCLVVWDWMKWTKGPALVKMGNHNLMVSVCLFMRWGLVFTSTRCSDFLPHLWCHWSHWLLLIYTVEACLTLHFSHHKIANSHWKWTKSSCFFGFIIFKNPVTVLILFFIAINLLYRLLIFNLFIFLVLQRSYNVHATFFLHCVVSACLYWSIWTGSWAQNDASCCAFPFFGC